MYIYGSYHNKSGEAIAVHIVTHGSTEEVRVIGDESSGISFTDDPVEIKSQVNDTFDHLLCQQATIRLLCRDYVEEFFSNQHRDVAVEIDRDGDMIFSGYLEPQAFSQGYNEAEDEVELTCIDALSALQYSLYRNIGTAEETYSHVRTNAKQRTLGEILGEILEDADRGTTTINEYSTSIYYDGSKAVDGSEAHRYTIFDDISVNELLFLGDEEDDTWTQEEVATEILKYLNLHALTIGQDIYLFSWETLRRGEPITFRGIMGTRDNREVSPRVITPENETVSGCDTQLDVAPTYNVLVLTDDVEEMENVVESPLESDSLRNAYPGMQKYMTELCSDGEGKSAYNGFKDLVQTGQTSYDGAQVVDWYVQVKDCTNWKLYGANRKDLVDDLCKGQKNQQALPNYLGEVTGAAALVAMGSVKKSNGGQDNSLVSSVDMTDCLVISVNGNGQDGETTYMPDEETLMNAIPCAEYVGNKAGGVFSPTDEETTNYIVVSGKMALNPLMKMTETYHTLKTMEWPKLPPDGNIWHNTVPSRNNGDGRYYTRQYWKAESWKDEVVADDDQNRMEQGGLLPFTGEGPQEYEFRYSAYGDSTDKLSKVGMVQCMLIIGDKCVVEKQPGQLLGSDGIPGTGNGQLSDYVWMDYKPREQCQSDDEYYQQSFSIGFDPKIGDKIIGTEYSIQNNLNYTDNVDAEGTAIPIRMGDKVSGKVQFTILGPVNCLWDDITRRHPTMFRHTKWSKNSVPLLAHLSNIIIKELEVKVVSDNGKAGSDGSDNDLVYMSDTDEDYVNKKDDLEMKLTTALTSKECRELGVKNGVNLSAPLRVDTGLSLLDIYNHGNGETAKPEQHYVNDYWQEWHKPRVVLTQGFMDTGEDGISPFDLFCQPTMGKTFHVQAISRNLTECTAEVVMKEVEG